MTEIQEGPQSDSIKGYKLPVIDTQTAKRNFPGYEKKQWYSLEDLRQGDFGGTTDTDTETDNQTGKRPYSTINSKGRPKMRSFKSSSKRTAEN